MGVPVGAGFRVGARVGDGVGASVSSAVGSAVDSAEVSFADSTIVGVAGCGMDFVGDALVVMNVEVVVVETGSAFSPVIDDSPIAIVVQPLRKVPKIEHSKTNKSMFALILCRDPDMELILLITSNDCPSSSQKRLNCLIQYNRSSAWKQPPGIFRDQMLSDRSVVRQSFWRDNVHEGSDRR